MEELRAVCKRVIGHIDYENETSLLTNGVIDSVDLVGLVGEIEETFHIEIPLDELTPENFDSICDMWNMIQRLQ